MEIELNQTPLDLKEPTELLPVEKDIRQSFIPSNPLQNPYNFDSIETKEQYIQRPSWHVKSLIGNIFILVFQIVMISLYISGSILYCYNCEILIILVCVLPHLLLYMPFVLRKNPLLQYLKNTVYGLSFRSQYEKFRAAKGCFIFHAECYHMQHSTQVTSQGNTYASQRKVVTHTVTKTLPIKGCVDITQPAKQLPSTAEYIFLHNTLTYRFSDEASRKTFERLWIGFKNTNKRDVHQRYSVNFRISGLKERITLCENHQPTNKTPYLIFFALIMLVWPFSMYIESTIARIRVNYVKKITI